MAILSKKLFFSDANAAQFYGVCYSYRHRLNLFTTWI